MSKTIIFKGWSLFKITRFIAYLTERICASRPHHSKLAEEIIERCHRAADGLVRRSAVQWAYDANTLGELYTDPFWQLLGSASAAAYWTVVWTREKHGRDRQEIAQYGLRAAEVVLQRAEEIVGVGPIAEVYLNMQYQEGVPLDYRDAAIAAFSVDHIELADEIMQRVQCYT